MPDTLVADTVTGVTSSAVASRAATRLAVDDSNALKVDQRASHLSEMLHTLYKQIIAAVRPKAPLLYAKLERICKQGAPFAEFHDGCIAWGIIEAMSLVGAMIPGEDASHDAALLALQLKPLLKGSSPDDFSTRMTFALENHIPYLERPFADDAFISRWVIKQVPFGQGARQPHLGHAGLSEVRFV